MSYVCYKCGIQLKVSESRGRKYYICPKCSYAISKHRLKWARRRLKGVRRSNKILDVYEEVYRNTLTDQKHTEFVCPLCKTKTVYETPYKQLVCSKCLLVIKQGHRVPKEIKEQVVKLHREEGYQYTELIRKFCLSPSMVHSILVRQRD